MNDGMQFRRHVFFLLPYVVGSEIAQHARTALRSLPRKYTINSSILMVSKERRRDYQINGDLALYPESEFSLRFIMMTHFFCLL